MMFCIWLESFQGARRTKERNEEIDRSYEGRKVHAHVSQERNCYSSSSLLTSA